MTKEKHIKAIQALESVFFEAGKLAVKLQRGISDRKKLATGIHDIDVVTDADIAVQELILSAASKTELSQCRLIAEEKSESVDKFNPKGELLFAIDPIDGTYRYAEGAPIYSLIISLQSPGLPLYTFAHYPAIGWTYRFIGSEYREEGKKPVLSVKEAGKIIAYSYGNPKQNMPDVVIREIEARGYNFRDKKELTLDCGATTLLLAEAVDGYYCEDPLAVDGLVSMHYASVKNCEIHSTVKKEWPKSGFGGIRYPGYYFVIRK